MTFTELLVYLAAGRLATWLAQTSGLLRPIWSRSDYLTEFSECDLCVGFWAYLALAFLWRPGAVFGLWPWWVELIIFAMLASFAAHIMRLGWQSKFSVTVVN